MSYYTGIKYVVVWNKGTQTETFTGKTADKKSRLHQNALRDAGYSSQRYERQWVEMKVPRGWISGIGDNPVSATEVTTLPDIRQFIVGSKVENANRDSGTVIELFPSEQEVKVRWSNGISTREHGEKLRLIEDSDEELQDKADQKYASMIMQR